MRRIFLTAISLSLLPVTAVFGQSAFWSYDENNIENFIPAQCDGQFDETHGGVFMPSVDDLYDQGELFLLEKGEARNNAGYCLLAAAIQGHIKAQYRVAQLYNKGLVLPQNDIAAYRWAFLAALGGSKEAEQLALTLEQVLTANEIEMATRPLEQLLPGLTSEKTATLSDQEVVLLEKKQALEDVNREIDQLLGIDYISPQTLSTYLPSNKTIMTELKNEPVQVETSAPVKKGSVLKRLNRPKVVKGQAGKIFNESDRME